jgi:hypothetical protein
MNSARSHKTPRAPSFRAFCERVGNPETPFARRRWLRAPSLARFLRQGWEAAKTHRLLTSVLVAALFFCFIKPAPIPVVAADQPAAARETLRVGMWTLWHDHDMTLTPTEPKEFTLLQTCERCPVEVLHAPAKIHAEKVGLNFSTAGKTVPSSEIRLSGPVTLTAHGETVTLHDPVAITAHDGRAQHRGHAARRELCGARGSE